MQADALVDLEGGATIVADPSTVARKATEALKRYRVLDEVVRTADLDHREVLLDADLGQVVADFLVGRAGSGARS